MASYPRSESISPNRLIALSLEFVIFFLCVEFLFLFFAHFLKEKTTIGANSTFTSQKKAKTRESLNNYHHLLQIREISWGMMFALLAIMMLTRILGDFFLSNEVWQQVFDLASILDYLLVILLLSYSLERNELHHHKYVVSKILLGMTLLMVIFMIIIPGSAEIYSFLSFPPLLFLFIAYGRVTILETRHLPRFRVPFFSVLFGLAIFISGLFLTREIITPLFDMNGRIMGDIAQIIGILLFAMGVMFLPSLDEFGWVLHLQQLYVIHPTGLCLFSYDFMHQQKKNIISLDSDLTTGIILAINALSQEMLAQPNKNRIDVIHKYGFTILLDSTAHIICAVLADEDKFMIRSKLRNFSDAFETKYSSFLEPWSGNTSVFNTATQLIAEIFTQE